MATVTLSIPSAVKKEMDKFSEIKWSEVFRTMIIKKTQLLKRLKARGEL